MLELTYMWNKDEITKFSQGQSLTKSKDFSSNMNKYCATLMASTLISIVSRYLLNDSASFKSFIRLISILLY